MTDTQEVRDSFELPTRRSPARPSSRPNTAVALVDLDNWHEANNSRSVETTLREVIAEIINKLLTTEPVTEFVAIRLYGGWTELGALSQSASEVASHLGAVSMAVRKSPLVAG